MISEELRTLVDKVEKGTLEEAAVAIGEIAPLCPTYLTKRPLAEALAGCSFPEPSGEVRTIAMFYFRLGDGGAERVVTLLAGLYTRMGYKVVLITHDEVNADAYDLPEGIEFERLGWLEPNYPQQSIEQRERDLAAILEKHHVDTMIYHAWMAYELLFDLALCRRAGVRFILVTHGVFCFPAAVEYDARNVLTLMPGDCKLVHAIVSQTEVNKYYYEHFAKHSFAIPNMVDFARIEQQLAAPAEREDPAPCVTWVGRLNDLKRPEDAIRVIDKVRESVPDARLVVVGRSDDGSYEEKLNELVEELELEDAVELVGYTKDVEKYYNTADVLLSTTESESFYLVMLEASAFGLPAVMYRLPHLPFDKSEGVVSVEVGDVDSAAEEIVRILGDEGLRQRMHEGALACYQQFRTFDYESAWREVLECTPDSGAPKDDGSLDTLAWNILLAHWAHGSERIWEHERQAVEDERLDHEETIEWYLGSKLTALPQKFLDIFAPIK